MLQKPLKTMGEMALLGVTLVWSTTFIVVQDTLIGWKPFALLLARFSIATCVLLFFIIGKKFNQQILRWGCILAFFDFIGYALQTYSLQYTTAANTAFFTSLSNVMVPIFSHVIRHKPWKVGTTVGIVIALLGIVLLLGKNVDDSLHIGDSMAIGCAIAFAIQVFLLETYAAQAPLQQLLFIEIVTLGLLSFAMMLITGQHIPAIAHMHTLNIGYLGIVATAGCLYAQLFGQSHTSATRAAFIFALEPILAAIFAWQLRHQFLNISQCAGGIMLVVAALIADRTWPKYKI